MNALKILKNEFNILIFLALLSGTLASSLLLNPFETNTQREVPIKSSHILASTKELQSLSIKHKKNMKERISQAKDNSLLSLSNYVNSNRFYKIGKIMEKVKKSDSLQQTTSLIREVQKITENSRLPEHKKIELTEKTTRLLERLQIVDEVKAGLAASEEPIKNMIKSLEKESLKANVHVKAYSINYSRLTLGLIVTTLTYCVFLLLNGKKRHLSQINEPSPEPKKKSLELTFSQSGELLWVSDDCPFILKTLFDNNRLTSWTDFQKRFFVDGSFSMSKQGTRVDFTIGNKSFYGHSFLEEDHTVTFCFRESRNQSKRFPTLAEEIEQKYQKRFNDAGIAFSMIYGQTSLHPNLNDPFYKKIDKLLDSILIQAYERNQVFSLTLDLSNLSSQSTPFNIKFKGIEVNKHWLNRRSPQQKYSTGNLLMEFQGRITISNSEKKVMSQISISGRPIELHS